MKHVTSAKKKKIIAALPADADIRWERIDDTIGEYLKRRDEIENLPRIKKQEKGKSKKFQKQLSEVEGPLRNLTKTILDPDFPFKKTLNDCAATSDKHPAQVLLTTLNMLGMLASSSEVVPETGLGERERAIRRAFICELRLRFYEIEEYFAKSSIRDVSDDEQKYEYSGPFHRFAAACFIGLPELRELTPAGVHETIIDALKGYS